MEIDLVTITSLYGGGLFFAGEQAPEVTHVLNRCIASAPEELTLSIAFVTYPALTRMPPPLRGRFCCHVRVAYAGDLEHGERLIAPLRALAPFLDTMRTMPLTDVGNIHADPTRPMRVNSNSAALVTGSEEIMDIVLPFLGPTTAFMLEVRPLGGTLARRPDIDNAVGHRTASVNLFTSAYPDSDQAGAADAQQRVYDAVAAHSIGGALRNFQPSGRTDATTAYSPDIAARLAEVKSVWDPRDLFSYAPSVTTAAPR